ncbi:hypothetical protein TSST111916_06445 [Tsukamurella strandjordii]|uniref:hypothetical protein n=1 Tax=Tsukamurella TaxID=2060 RepID=UPI001C7DC287|nr:hypothetical protein [Tsukamurella sp. TY48]GIZ98195.1 hypothetical protein TTY48_28070 [Tsukamurella sp. TY48]
MAKTAAARAVDVFVSAVESRGGKAEVTTKGIITHVTVIAGDVVTTLRVKGTDGDAWQARKTEATVAKAPVTAWALVDLSDGAPIALVSAEDYAAHVQKLATTWESKNPGKPLTAATTLAVTADAVAGWEDDWALIGLGGLGAKVTKATKGAEQAVIDTTAKAASKVAGKVAEKTVEKAGEKVTERTAAKRTAAKKAVKAPAKKVAAKKTAVKSAAASKAAAAKKAPAKKAAAAKSAVASKAAASKAAASNAAKKAPAKAPAKKAAAKTPVKASEAKITPIAAQKEAAAQGKAPASVTPKKDTKPAAKPAATSGKSTAKESAKPAAKAEGKAKDSKDKGKQKSLLQRIPVVGRLL